MDKFHDSLCVCACVKFDYQIAIGLWDVAIVGRLVDAAAPRHQPLHEPQVAPQGRDVDGRGPVLPVGAVHVRLRAE